MISFKPVDSGRRHPLLRRAGVGLPGPKTHPKVRVRRRALLHQRSWSEHLRVVLGEDVAFESVEQRVVVGLHVLFFSDLRPRCFDKPCGALGKEAASTTSAM